MARSAASCAAATFFLLMLALWSFTPFDPAGASLKYHFPWHSMSMPVIVYDGKLKALIEDVSHAEQPFLSALDNISSQQMGTTRFPSLKRSQCFKYGIGHMYKLYGKGQGLDHVSSYEFIHHFLGLNPTPVKRQSESGSSSWCGSRTAPCAVVFMGTSEMWRLD